MARVEIVLSRRKRPRVPPIVRPSPETAWKEIYFDVIVMSDEE